MKKTIVLLLAAAGMAMGGTEKPLELNWKADNSADLKTDANGNTINYSQYSWASNTITVAMTLNWSALMEDKKDGAHVLFEISDDSEKNHGLCVYFGNKGNYIDAWTSGQDDETFSLTLDNKWKNSAKAAIVYTSHVPNESTSTTTYSTYLYLWDENEQVTLLTLVDNNVIENGEVEDYTHNVCLSQLSSISYNSDYVTNIDVYADIIGKNESLNLAERVTTTPSTPGTDSTIPEPTTATLSLLALAGLAARRRR